MNSKLILIFIIIFKIVFVTSKYHEFINQQFCDLCRRNSSLFSETDATTSPSTISQRLLVWFPPLTAPAGASDACQRHLEDFNSDLRQLKTWALLINCPRPCQSERKDNPLINPVGVQSLRITQSAGNNVNGWLANIVHDSTAKPPSGLLNGNVNQFGDFDQCLAVNRPGRSKLQGKYCLASLQLRLGCKAHSQVAHMHRLMHSNYLFTSELDDPGHRVPRFSSIQWGVCVPNTCTGRDVAAALQQQAAALLTGTGVDVDVRLHEDMCQVLEDKPWPLGTIVTGILFLALIAAILAATVLDVYFPEKLSRTWHCASLKRNISKLVAFDAPPAPDDIGSVHGIRFVNSAMLILSHKSMAVMYLPFANRTRMATEAGEPWAVMSRAASLYTDPFLMLSGLLTTTALLRRLQRHGSISLTSEYFSRFIRIVPSLAVLMLICTWLMPLVGRGPLWNQVVTHHSDICKKYWWRNILFIHNYFGFKDMCLTHTHHLGIDGQLFVVTPLAVWLLTRWPRRALRLLLALAALSTIARFVVTSQRQLSNFVAYGTSVKQLFATADHMYILPAYRATVYIMGVLLGYMLHNSKGRLLSKAQLRAGWACAVGALCASFVGTVEMGAPDYEYNVLLSAHYAAVSPIMWCAFFGWIIYVSHLGYDNWLTKLLSWNKFAMWTKISYSVYLTQFPVFFYYVGMTRVPIYYNLLEQLFNWKEFFYVIVCSLILTLVVEMPCQNLRSLANSKRRINKERTLDKINHLNVTAKSTSISNAVDIVEKYRLVSEDRVK